MVANVLKDAFAASRRYNCALVNFLLLMESISGLQHINDHNSLGDFILSLAEETESDDASAWKRKSLKVYFLMISDFIESVYSKVNSPSWRDWAALLYLPLITDPSDNGSMLVLRDDVRQQCIEIAPPKMISTPNDIVLYLKSLIVQLDNNEKIENDTIYLFLEALAAWVSSLDSLCHNLGKPLPEMPQWQLIANGFYAGLIYE